MLSWWIKYQNCNNKDTKTADILSLDNIHMYIKKKSNKAYILTNFSGRTEKIYLYNSLSNRSDTVLNSLATKLSSPPCPDAATAIWYFFSTSDKRFWSLTYSSLRRLRWFWSFATSPGKTKARTYMYMHMYMYDIPPASLFQFHRKRMAW